MQRGRIAKRIAGTRDDGSRLYLDGLDAVRDAAKNGADGIRTRGDGEGCENTRSDPLHPTDHSVKIPDHSIKRSRGTTDFADSVADRAILGLSVANDRVFVRVHQSRICEPRAKVGRARFEGEEHLRCRFSICGDAAW